MENKADKYKLKSLDNSLELIDLLIKADSELGITEISKQINLGKSTIYRILSTLQDRGYVVQNTNTEKYKLGYRFVTIANELLQKLDTITVTRDMVEDLVEKVGVTAFLASYSNYQITAIERYACKNERSIGYNTGTCFPAHFTAAGKAILSYFDSDDLNDYFGKAKFDKNTPYTLISRAEISKNIFDGKQMGYFENQQETDEGVVAFAVPILGKGSKAIASLSLCGPASKMNDFKETLTVALIATGKECSNICRKTSMI